MAEKSENVTGKKRTTNKSRAGAKSSISVETLRNEIGERAHAIYIERHAANIPGDELSDWLQAEAEVKKRHGVK